LEDGTQKRRIVLLAVLFEGGAIWVAWILGVLLKQPALADFHWNRNDLLFGMVASLPMLGLFLSLFRWRIGPVIHVRQFLVEFIRPLFRECTLIELGLISLLAGVGEEMLFRAVIQGTISDWINPVTGLIVASVLFGLCHLINPAYALMAGVMGIYLGGLWLISGNLLTPIVTHAVYDFLALVYFLRLDKTLGTSR
jgi:uncharacterized protein